MKKYCLIAIGLMVVVSISLLSDFNVVSGDTFSTGASTNSLPGKLDVTGSVIVHQSVQQFQGTLIETAGTVTIDFDSTPTDNYCTITGNVAIATANRGTNKWAMLTITGCSTNSAITWPSGARSPTGFPSISTAAKIMSIVVKASGTADANTQWWISEEP